MIKSIFATCAVISYAFTANVAPSFAADLGCSTASYYGVGDGYHGQTTANGERFNAYGISVAHRYLPFGTKLKITDQETGKSVIARVNDRGPFVHGRVIDLSYGAFSAISRPSKGVTRVCIARA